MKKNNANISQKRNYKNDRESIKEFLENSPSYHNAMQMIKDGEIKTLFINLDDVGSYFGNFELVQRIEGNTVRYLKMFYQAVDDELKLIERNPELGPFRDTISFYEGDGNGNETTKRFDIPEGYFRRYDLKIRCRKNMDVTPLRHIRGLCIGKLLRTQGIVCRVSDVKCEVEFVNYICDTCSHEVFLDVREQTTYTPASKCPECSKRKVFGVMQLNTRGSRFQKFQEIVIQEISTNVPRGGVPKKLKIYLRGDLTRQVVPGDEIFLGGYFIQKPIYGYRSQYSYIVGTYLEGQSISHLKKKYTELTEDRRLMENIMDVVERMEPMKLYEKLALSLCPEIHGLEDVKKALLLQLVGGVERRLKSGVHLRGDLNIALVGDPGVGKSQLLKYIATVCPRGVYTTGKGSSGVGLTAAVIRDKHTGEYVLEGGSLVLADKGLCCIDEFDKMSDLDVSSLHEVMEQQSISVAKAGITTTLNARASLLAAANPQYGTYDKRKNVLQNINMPAALLSRFDLIFLLLDNNSGDSNIFLSKHILSVHIHGKYLTKKEKERENPLRKRNMEDDIDDDEEEDIIDEEENEIFSVSFIKGFIAKARSLEPKVPQDKNFMNFISEVYCDMRNTQGTDEIYGSTPRTLLSILRLSQALAKIRFAPCITRQDVMEAKRLMDSCKSSLSNNLDSRNAMGVHRRSPKEIVYDLIKKHYKNNGNKSDIPLRDLDESLEANGLDRAQALEVIKEYDEIGIWAYVDETEVITFSN